METKERKIDVDAWGDMEEKSNCCDAQIINGKCRDCKEGVE
jgi:hypothetical protein